MRRGLIFWTFIFLLIFPIAYAAEISLTETSIQNIIVEDGTAKYSVTIINDQDSSDNFRFVLPTVYSGWRIETDPAQIVIGDKESETVELKIIPTRTPTPGSYGLGMKLVSNSDDSVFTEHTFTFKVVTYDQAIKTTLISPDSINPNKENLFRLELENKYDVTIKDVKAVLETRYFKKEIDITLNPYETVTKEFLVEFQPPVEKGQTELFIKIININGEEVIKRQETIEIGDYSIIESITSPLSGFLLKKERVLKTNNGNTISTESYSKKLGYFEKIFTKTNIEPNSITREGNDYILNWEFELSPGESRSIEIETNYRYFTLIIIILIIIVYLIYRLRRRDLSVSKKLLSLRRSKEGISSMHISIILKNRSNKPVNSVKVIDSVFNAAEKPENLGPVKPKVVQEGERVSRMMWDIPVMRAGDKKVLSYSVRSRMPIHAKAKLPPAVVKYVANKNRYLVKSKSVDIV